MDRRQLVTLALLFSCFLTVSPSLLAQSLRAGSEVPVAHSAVGEAFLGQAAPAVASNGEDFFVAWMDFRSGSYIADVFGTRVSGDGVVLDPTNIPVAATSSGELNPAAAWDGAEYLVAYDMYTPNVPGWNTDAAEVRADGTFVARGVWLNASSNIYVAPVLCVNDGRVLLGWAASGDAKLYATGISDSAASEPVAVAHSISAIVPWHDSFLALGTARQEPNVVATVISRLGALLRTLTIARGIEGGAWNVRAASCGDEALVVLPTQSALVLLYVDRDWTITNIDEIAVTNATATVAWDGSEFVVAWVAAGDGKEIRAKRVSRDGRVLDPSPLVVYRSAAPTAYISSAGANGSVLVVWDENAAYRSDMNYRATSIVGAIVRSSHFASHTSPAAIQLSRSPSPQVDASLTVTRDGYFAAWQELVDEAASVWDRSQAGALVAAYLGRDGTLRGDRIAIAQNVSSPADAVTVSSDEGEVVFWRDSGFLIGAIVNGGTTDVRRFSIPEAQAAGRPAVVFDDKGYAIAYPTWSETFLARLKRDLTLEAPPVRIATGSQPPAIVPDGDALLVATGTLIPACQILCTSPPAPEIRLSRLTRDGTVIRDAVIAQEWAETSMDCGPNCLVAWKANDGLAYVIVSRDLTIVSERRLLPRATPEETPRVAWDGVRFVLTWSEENGEASEVRVATMTADGATSESHVVATSRARMFEWMYSPFPRPLVASTRDGSSLLLYGRFDESATGGGVRKLFSRTMGWIVKGRALRR